MAQNNVKTDQKISFKHWVKDNPLAGEEGDEDSQAALTAVANLYSEEVLRSAAKPTGSMDDFEEVLRVQFEGKFPYADWTAVTSVIEDWYDQ